ncbi:MAG: VCBS repeat-containing protein, partial [Planctomycetota bacterium]
RAQPQTQSEQVPDAPRKENKADPAIRLQAQPDVATKSLDDVGQLVQSAVQIVDDPTVTELLNQSTTAQLNRLFERVIHPDSKKSPSTRKDEFSESKLDPLIPDQPVVVLDEGGLILKRWRRVTDEPNPKQVSFEVASEDLRRRFGALTGKKSQKLKTVRVELEGSECRTVCRVALSGHANDASLQVHSLVHCKWRLGNDAAKATPVLLGLELSDYEEVAYRGQTDTWFSECTPSFMTQVPEYKSQLALSCDYWAQRIDQRLGANFMGYQGVSVGDINGDLLDDVYVCQTGGLPNLLLQQNPDGTVKNVAGSMGVDLLDSSRCALFVDLDNDGDQDLVVASVTGTLFYEQSDGRLKLRKRIANSRLGYSLAAADYDLDGDLDIYACCYHAPPEAEVGNPVPYFDANNGSPNVMIANDGAWQFHDATKECGLDAANTRWSYAASWEDYDNDGDPDLYVANDFGRNCLYRNDLINSNGERGAKPAFVNVADEVAVEDVASGMSAAWGDYDRDGRMDLYVSNMFSSAGERVTYQRNFFSANEDARGKLRRLARGNSLFRNSEGGFQDVTLDASVEMGRWAWSSLFCDLNNDGWEDLFVANGNYTGEDNGDL